MKTAEIDQSKLKSKAPEDGSRRYKEGTFPSYDEEHQRLASRSKILNPDNARRDFKNAFSGTGIGECQRDLIQLVGNDDGKYQEEGSWYSALIPAAKNNLKTIYADYKRWQEKQVTSGQSLEAPENWPDGLLTERLKAEARLDARRREKHLIEERIEQLKKEQNKTEPDEPMLPDGPVGHFRERYIGKFRKESLLDSVDGQHIGYSPSGKPYIDQEDSPYHEMPVATYRQMSKLWKRENNIMNHDLHVRKNDFKEKAKKKGIDLPVMFTKRSFEALIKGESVFKNQNDFPDFEEWPENPEWPEGAKKITDIEAEKVDS